jgi:hypothetical protein
MAKQCKSFFFFLFKNKANHELHCKRHVMGKFSTVWKCKILLVLKKGEIMCNNNKLPITGEDLNATILSLLRGSSQYNQTDELHGMAIAFMRHARLVLDDAPIDTGSIFAKMGIAEFSIKLYAFCGSTLK